MAGNKMKISGIMCAFVIIVMCFIYSINLQPVVIGDSNNIENQLGFNKEFNGTSSQLSNFLSYKDFTDFIKKDNKGTDLKNGWEGFAPVLLRSFSQSSAMIDIDGDSVDLTTAETSSYDSGKSDSTIDYSNTNIQVEGVDEPDIVKTDGQYLYILDNNRVLIVKAIPAENAKIESVIILEQDYQLQNIFIHGNKLVIFAQENYYVIYDSLEDEEIQNSQIPSLWYSSPDTHIIIMNISNLEEPDEIKDVVVAGRLSASRLIGDYVYVITTQNQYDINPINEDQIIKPEIIVNQKPIIIDLSDIYYVDIPDDSNTINNIVSINIEDESKEVQTKIFILGYLDVLYVSKNNIYITHNSRSYNFDIIEEIVREIIDPILPDDIKSELDLVEKLSLTNYQKTTVAEWIIQNYTYSISEEEKSEIAREINRRIERTTTLHRISISQGKITYEAQGQVTGHISNQFSLSEYNGYLRVSSTNQGTTIQGFFNRLETHNNIIILNMDLEIISSIEGLAPGERIYATRFIGEMCYLVTFRQIDPFFVIDLSDPENPNVLGELKIPGYSTYLHPYDESHIIGIGMDSNNVKVSLFDVTDLQNPVELSKYEITTKSDSWIWGQSTALYEHKAFLFDKEKNLLVIPAGDHSKQSAHVFDITLDKGIELKGVISHGEEVNDEEYEYWGYYGNSIKRTLYIGEVLYTISDNFVKMNSLDDLFEINYIELE